MAATESTIRFSGHTLDKATKAKVSEFNFNLIISLDSSSALYITVHQSISR